MAERRMFAKTIVLSDAFLDMPLSARCLYFTLGMLADDDGFVNSPKSIMRQCGATEDDMKVLLAKKFVLAFETGVIVIKHWRINNYLRNDRYHETAYLEEKQTLTVDKNGVYSIGIPSEEVVGIPSGTPTVYRGKDSIGKYSIDNNNNICERNASHNGLSNAEVTQSNSKAIRHKYGSYQNVLLSDEELKKLQTEFPSDWEERIERVSLYVASKGKGYKDYLATIRSWARREKGGVVSGGTHQRTTSALGKAKGNFDDLRNLI